MESLPQVRVSPVPRTRAADRLCPDLLAGLPQKLAGQGRRRTGTPGQYYLAWGNPTVIVHCGVPRPRKFVVGQQTVDIAPPGGQVVRWFTEPADSGATWTAVDRPVYVSVFVPDGGPTTDILQDVGKVIVRTMPARPIRPGPLLHPPS